MTTDRSAPASLPMMLLHVYVSFLENNPAVGAYAKQLSFMF